jgi:hypothetical protein
VADPTPSQPPANDPREIVKAEPVDLELPPVAPPVTKTPVQFNQQVNIYQQIPQTAWDRLTADQVVELSKVIVQQIDTADKRQFDYAISQAKSEHDGKKLAIICGSGVAALGFTVTTYLAIHGQIVPALSISLPLATILAVIVGKRFLD